MIFKTLNSTYEVDRDGRRIRRLSGSNAPTARQSDDKEWKQFHAISPIIEDQSVVIVWKIVDGVGNATGTSAVQEIVEEYPEVVFSC